MIIGRTIQVFGGGIVPLAFGIARDELPTRRWGQAVSVLAGPIVDILGYHWQFWLFWLPGIATVAAALAAAVIIPTSSVRASDRIAWGAAFLLAGWLVALFVAISEAPRRGWTSPLVAGCLVAAVSLAIAWVRYELVAVTPLIDLRMLQSRLLWAVDLMAFLSGTAMFATLAFTTQLTQTPTSFGYGFGLSLTMAGVVQLPTAASGLIAGVTISRAVPPLHPKWIAVGALVAMTCGLVGLAWFHDEIWHICIANALTGGGLGAVATCQATLISTCVRPDQTAARQRGQRDDPCHRRHDRHHVDGQSPGRAGMSTQPVRLVRSATRSGSRCSPVRWPAAYLRRWRYRTCAVGTCSQWSTATGCTTRWT